MAITPDRRQAHFHRPPRHTTITPKETIDDGCRQERRVHNDHRERRPRTDGRSAGASSTLQRFFADGRAPLIWGVIWGLLQAAAPLGFWWLDAATVYGMSIALIATVYIGFAVADGRPAVIAVETTVAGAFVVLAAVGVTGSAWLIVIGFVGHGLKDLWQHRTHFVANTRWWPPFCMTIDFVAAAIIAVAIISGVTFHQ